MIEGWATAIDTMPELSAVAAALARRRPSARMTAIPESCAMSFDRFCEEEALVRAWRSLEACATLPMQSHAFAAALAGTFLADTRIQVFFIRGQGDIAALLTLCREPGRFARWRMVGAHEVCEPDDALYRNPQAARDLAEAIVADGRALEVDRVPAGSELIPALRGALRGKGFMSVRPATPTPTIELDERWTDPASRFNSGRRSDFRRAARRASEYGEVSFEIASPGPDEFDA
jgi:CelD/BcsL family acetyltransferase involved in cellulose biosynthesis